MAHEVLDAAHVDVGEVHHRAAVADQLHGDQEQCKVDLECVTGHYKARQIAAKQAAGFKLYNQDYRGRSAERGEDLIGEVMSL